MPATRTPSPCPCPSPGPRSSRSSSLVPSDIETSTPHSNSHSTRKLTTLNTIALCVSLQIGAGVFAAPSQVSQFVPSPGVGVLAWFVGGLFVWTGANTFVELGVRIPENGGVQEYLRHCFGEWMGFVFAVTWVVLTKPASMGIVSLVFAEYLLASARHLGLPVGRGRVDGGGGGGETGPLDPGLVKLVGFVGLAGLTAINCLGATTGATVANVFFFGKVTALLSIVVLGFGSQFVGQAKGVPDSQGGWFGTDPGYDQLSLWEQVGRIVTALFGVLYVYGGWESIGFYLGDVRNPAKALPRAMGISMGMCIVGFSLMSAALYMALPMQTIREDKAVAVDLGRHLFGAPGVFIYSLVVSISSLGSMNSNIFATGRLVAKAGERKYFPSILANRHCSPGQDEPAYYKQQLPWIPTFLKWPVMKFAKMTETLRLEKDVPIYGMILNLFFSSMYLFLGTFNHLITFVGMSEYFFWFLCTIGLFTIRMRKSDVPSSLNNGLSTSSSEADGGGFNDGGNGTREYKTGTWNPVIFVFFSGFVVLRGMVSDPLQAVGILGCMGGGWLLWLLKERGGFRRESREQEHAPFLGTGS